MSRNNCKLEDKLHVRKKRALTYYNNFLGLMHDRWIISCGICVYCDGGSKTDHHTPGNECNQRKMASETRPVNTPEGKAKIILCFCWALCL